MLKKSVIKYESRLQLGRDQVLFLRNRVRVRVTKTIFQKTHMFQKNR